MEGLDPDELIRSLPSHILQDWESKKKQVKDLCEKIGYGFVISEASRIWQEKDPRGAFSVGPCVLFTEPCDCERKTKCDKCYGCGWNFK